MREPPTRVIPISTGAAISAVARTSPSARARRGGAVGRAVAELALQGTFGGFAQAVPHSELTKIFTQG
jgi:hypothetical protein